MRLEVLRQRYPIDWYGPKVETGRHYCEATGLEVHYWTDDRDDYTHGWHYTKGEKLKHGYYMDLGKFAITGELAQSPDGSTTIGQIRRRDGSYDLVDLPLKRRWPQRIWGFLERWGWKPMPVITRVPDHAQAFDLNGRGELAVAIGTQLHHWDKEHGLTPWKAFTERIEDVTYLPDGSLAVLTRPPSREVGAVFHILDGESSERLDFQQVYPEHYQKALERCTNVSWLQGADNATRERFLQNSAWLGDYHRDYGWKRHVQLESCIAVEGTLWTYDVATGQAAQGATLEMPPEGPMDADWHQRLAQLGSTIALLPADGKPATVPLWNAGTGKLEASLPLVTGVEVKEGKLRFRQPDGVQRELDAEQLARVPTEPWYVEGWKAQLLGGKSVEGTAAPVRIENGALRVGASTLKLRRGFGGL